MAILKELKEKYAKRESTAEHVAVVYAGLRYNDQTFAWLEKGFQASDDMEGLIYGGVYDGIRSDPRYVDLVRRMGLEP